jgi:hypothetical protein
MSLQFGSITRMRFGTPSGMLSYCGALERLGHYLEATGTVVNADLLLARESSGRNLFLYVLDHCDFLHTDQSTELKSRQGKKTSSKDPRTRYLIV